MSWVSFLRVWLLFCGATKGTPNQTIGKTGLLWYNLLRRVYPVRLFSKKNLCNQKAFYERIPSQPSQIQIEQREMGVSLWYSVLIAQFLSISIYQNRPSFKRKKISPYNQIRKIHIHEGVRLESTFYYKSRVERRLTTQFEGDTPCCLYEDFPSLLLLFEIGPGRV